MNYVCLFCQRDCVEIDAPTERPPACYHCPFCNVYFIMDDNGNLDITTYEISLNNGDYFLELWRGRNETLVFGSTEGFSLLMRLPHCLQGVTPDNVVDKLKTLLTFS